MAHPCPSTHTRGASTYVHSARSTPTHGAHPRTEHSPAARPIRGTPARTRSTPPPTRAPPTPPPRLPQLPRPALSRGTPPHDRPNLLQSPHKSPSNSPQALPGAPKSLPKPPGSPIDPLGIPSNPPPTPPNPAPPNLPSPSHPPLRFLHRITRLRMAFTRSGWGGSRRSRGAPRCLPSLCRGGSGAEFRSRWLPVNSSQSPVPIRAPFCSQSQRGVLTGSLSMSGPSASPGTGSASQWIPGSVPSGSGSGSAPRTALGGSAPFYTRARPHVGLH